MCPPSERGGEHGGPALLGSHPFSATSCVAVAKLLDLSVPLFTYWQLKVATCLPALPGHLEY